MSQRPSSFVPPSSASPTTSRLRILFLEPSSKPLRSHIKDRRTPSLIPALLQVLTGVPPPPFLSLDDDGGSSGQSDDNIERRSFAGYTTHPPLTVRTRYFEQRVSVWCDEVPLPGSFAKHGGLEHLKDEAGHQANGAESMDGAGEPTTQVWLTQMLSAEAVEVRSVIGAIILALPVPDVMELRAGPLEESTRLAGFGEVEDDEHSIPQRMSHLKLREEYLDIIEAVGLLRSTIEGERTQHDSSGHGSAGDVATVILLQGSLPQTEKSLRGANAPTPVDHDGADALVEAVEEQLVTDRTIFGCDVVSWDGRVTAATGTEQTEEPGGGAERNSTKKVKRNIYGEKTGIDRVREVLEAVDWSVVPLPSPPSASASPPHRRKNSNDEPQQHRHHHRSTSTEPALNWDLFALDQDLEPDHSGHDPDDNDDNNDSEADAAGDQATMVEQLQGLLHQAMAIREAGAELPTAERDRYARSMVAKLMREL